MSYMQNTKERKAPTYLSSICAENMRRSNASAVADNEPPLRTIIELKRLLVDADDEHRVPVASVRAWSDIGKPKNGANGNSAKSDGCSARCKLAHGNEVICCAGTGKPMSPSTSSTTRRVKSNHKQCDSNDCDDDLWAEATAATDDDEDDDTNNEENAEQEVSARVSIPSISQNFRVRFCVAMRYGNVHRTTANGPPHKHECNAFAAQCVYSTSEQINK